MMSPKAFLALLVIGLFCGSPLALASEPTPKEGYSMMVKASDGKTYKITSYPPLHGLLEVRDNDKLLGTVAINEDGSFAAINPNTMAEFQALSNAHAAWLKAGGANVLRERRKADLATVKTTPPYLAVRVVLTDPEMSDVKIRKALEAVRVRDCSNAAIRRDPKVNGLVLLQILTGESGEVLEVSADTTRPRGSLTDEFVDCLSTAIKGAQFPHLQGSGRSLITFAIQADVLP